MVDKGNRPWVADIDGVWLFDLKTRKGKKLALPDIQFANKGRLISAAIATPRA